MSMPIIGRCKICDKLRDPDDLGVVKIPEILDGEPMDGCWRYIQYCVDNTECVRKAEELKL